eukprot:TRINITY_DN6287_c0_g1_i2.p5 TRINITY_DN6287_c0_g1~~TRINITY_DN6287_c0_g1_i2.p5  ORF type:complete len:111 (-),score=7.25 TRINITY_DN6287_c0_g1_i2:3148-3480(-)
MLSLAASQLVRNWTACTESRWNFIVFIRFLGYFTSSTSVLDPAVSTTAFIQSLLVASGRAQFGGSYAVLVLRVSFFFSRVLRDDGVFIVHMIPAGCCMIAFTTTWSCLGV